MEKNDTDKRTMKIVFIYLPILILIIVFWKQILIYSVGIFIDEGGNDSNPLYIAMKNNDLKEFKEYLISRKIGVNVYDLSHIASIKNQDFLNLLIDDYNFDVDYGAHTSSNTTALMLSANVLDYRAMERLINKGADVNFKNNQNLTPLIKTIDVYANNITRKKEKYKIVKLLINSGADVNSEDGKGLIQPPLGTALDASDLELMNFLIDSGANIHFKDNDGYNYFFYSYKPEYSKLLLLKGLDINSNDNLKNESPLLNFVENSAYDLDSIKYFILSGADICHKDNEGSTIINYAERKNTYLHNREANNEFYKKKVKKNRTSDIYKFLEKEYNKRCLDKSSQDDLIQTTIQTTNAFVQGMTYDKSFNISQ